MNPQYLLLIIVAVACPVGMGAAMWLMMRQSAHQQMPMGTMPTMTPEQQLSALQARKEQLEKEIGELEAVQALEERRKQLEREAAARSEQTPA